MAVVFKSYEIVLIRVFLHAELAKTEMKSMVFEKYAKNGKNIIYYHYFLFFVIFV